MTNNAEWNEFLDNLLSDAIREHEASKESEYLRQRKATIDEMLTTNLNADEKLFVDEILFELGLAAERETEIGYRRGLRDCVWILKNLGVIA